MHQINYPLNNIYCWEGELVLIYFEKQHFERISKVHSSSSTTSNLKNLKIIWFLRIIKISEIGFHRKTTASLKKKKASGHAWYESLCILVLLIFRTRGPCLCTHTHIIIFSRRLACKYNIYT